MDHIKNFHSVPSLYFFLLFSLGITLCWFLGDIFSLTPLLIFFALVFTSLYFFFKTDKGFFSVVLFLFVISGFIRMWLALFSISPAEMHMFNSDYSAFQGTVIDTDFRDAKSNIYVLACEKIFIKNEPFPASGLIVINQGTYKQSFKYGDVLKINGRPGMPTLPSNPGEFNYRRYLQLNDKFFYLRLEREAVITKISSAKGNFLQREIFNPVRNVIRKTVDNNLSGYSPSIVKALVLGERGNLDKGVIYDFQKTGVIHVLAISGLHVGFIALILQFGLALMRVPKKPAMVITIVFLLLFAALVNFKAPVVRASLMMGFYYLSKFINRPQKPLNVIALAGIVILSVQPEQLLLPGFQYSFSAVFGLIYGTEKLNHLFPFFKFDGHISAFLNTYVRTPFVGSLSAILATFPLTWYYFGSIQSGAIVANLFIIPYIALILFLSILFVCFSWFPLFPVAGIAILIDFLIDIMIKSISGFAQLPFIQVQTGHPQILYLALAVVMIFLLFNIRYSSARLGLIGVLIIAAALIFSSQFIPGKLKLTFINVGQGDATLLQFPNKKTALIDAGNKGFGFDAGERYVDPVLKYYGLQKIDYLIASHPHSDHIGGFEFILNNYSVDTLVLNAFHMDSKLYKSIIKLAVEKKVFIKNSSAGDMIHADQCTRLYVLHPTKPFEYGEANSGEKINNSSLVIKLVYGKSSILLNGDAETGAEQAMLKYGSFLDCDLLKVGHHGSRTSSSDFFLDQAKPEQAVISVGRRNKFKHPSPETILKYTRRHIPVFRTDHSGAVVFESDGRRLIRYNWRE